MATMRKGFQGFLSQLLVIPHYAEVLPVLVILLSFPFFNFFPFLPLFANTIQCPPWIYCSLNIQSLLMSGLVLVLDCKDQPHRKGIMYQEFMMGLVCSQNCPGFILLILTTTLPGKHYHYPHFTCKTQTGLSALHELTRIVSGGCQDLSPELTIFTPRLYCLSNQWCSIGHAILNHVAWSLKAWMLGWLQSYWDSPQGIGAGWSWCVLLVKIHSVWYHCVCVCVCVQLYVPMSMYCNKAPWEALTYKSCTYCSSCTSMWGCWSWRTEAWASTEGQTQLRQHRGLLPLLSVNETSDPWPGWTNQKEVTGASH